MSTKRKDPDETPRVHDPHPLFQLGSPPTDVERAHVLKIQVYRYNTGGGPPVFATSIDRPDDVIDPAQLRALVGGGRYQIRAQSNGGGGKTYGSMLPGHTNYEFDGEPVRPHAPPPAAAAPAGGSFLDSGSRIMEMASSGFALVFKIMSESKEAAAEREERRARREQEAREAARAEQDRRDRLDREEREERERRRQEEAREAAEARRAADERRAAAEHEARLEQARMMAEERRAAQEQQMMMFKHMMDKSSAPPPSPDNSLTNTLLTHVLSNQNKAPPAPQEASAEKVIDLAKKLKELQGAEDSKMMTDIAAAAISTLGPTPVGQEVLARAASLFGLFPKPEPPAPPPPIVVTPAPQEQPPPPPAVVPQQIEVEAGPVTIN